MEARGPDVATWLGYGGARGGGKSGAARRLMMARRLRWPNTTGFIIRRNFPDLYENHIVKFQEEYPDLAGGYEAGHKQYRLPNGSRIAFRYADTETEIRQLSRGPEAMDVFVDQAEQFSEQELLWLHTPNRWPGAGPGVCKTVLFFNPGGPGTEFLRRVFWLRQFQDTERPSNYNFTQAYGWDNWQWFRTQVEMSEREFYLLSDAERFHLFITETSYGRELNSLPASMRVGELMGSFSSFSGQYFQGVWDEEKCVLPRAKVAEIIQPWWRRWMAQDWGFGDHDAHIWFAVGKLSPSEWERHFGGRCDWPMDIVIAYREQVIHQRAEADLALDIVNATPVEERKYISRFFLSQDAFGQKARQQGAHSVGEAFQKILERYDLPGPEPADQERVTGWRFMFQCLRQACLAGMTFDAERAKQGPAFFVSAECPQIISCIPLATRDPKDPEDVIRVAGAIWEDVTDAIRYGLKSMLDPKSKAPRDVRQLEEYNRFEDPTARALAMRRFEIKEHETKRRKGNFR
jgi:phage terminase large subunit